MPLGAYRLGSFAAAGPTRTAWTLVTARATSTLPNAVSTQSRWGTHSLEFTNTNPGNSIAFTKSGVNATASLANGGLVPIGQTEAFTVEFWWRPGSRLGSGQMEWYNCGREGVALGVQSSNNLYFAQAGISYSLTSSGFALQQNVWQHIVGMRSSTGARWLIVNGVVRAYTASSPNYSFTNPYGGWTTPMIGQDTFPNVVNPLHGFVNDFRVSAAAIYPTNVTTVGTTSFSVPTGPLTNLASTVLLIPGDDGQVIDDPSR